MPANLFAVVSLRQLAELASRACPSDALARDANALAGEVEAALRMHGQIETEQGRIWAYEVDGYGNSLRNG